MYLNNSWTQKDTQSNRYIKSKECWNLNCDSGIPPSLHKRLGRLSLKAHFHLCRLCLCGYMISASLNKEGEGVGVAGDVEGGGAAHVDSVDT